LYGLQKPTLPQPELFPGAMAISWRRQSVFDANQISMETSRALVFSKR